MKNIQLKDAAQLALKKMPSAEQEAISQVRERINSKFLAGISNMQKVFAFLAFVY